MLDGSRSFHLPTRVCIRNFVSQERRKARAGARTAAGALELSFATSPRHGLLKPNHKPDSDLKKSTSTPDKNACASCRLGHPAITDFGNEQASTACVMTCTCRLARHCDHARRECMRFQTWLARHAATGCGQRPGASFCPTNDEGLAQGPVQPNSTPGTLDLYFLSFPAREPSRTSLVYRHLSLRTSTLTLRRGDENLKEEEERS